MSMNRSILSMSIALALLSATRGAGAAPDAAPPAAAAAEPQTLPPISVTAKADF